MAFEQIKSTTEVKESLIRREYMKEIKKNPAAMVEIYRSARDSFADNAERTTFLNFIIKMIVNQWKFNAELCNTDEFRGSVYAYLLARSIDKETGRPRGLIPYLASFTAERKTKDKDGKTWTTSDIEQIQARISRDQKVIDGLKNKSSKIYAKALESMNAIHRERGGNTGEVRVQLAISQHSEALKPQAEKLKTLTGLIKLAGVQNGKWFTPDRDASMGGFTFTDKVMDENLGALEGLDLASLANLG